MRINYYYINSILKNYFRIIFITSLVGKFLLPTTFNSYITELLKYMGIVSLYYEHGLELYYLKFILFVSVQTAEFSLVYFSISDEKIFQTGVFVLTLVFLTISLVTYIFKIPGDCGCFGSIIVFENSISKLIFNVLNFTISLVYLFLRTISKQRILNTKIGLND